jgi:hypothetical protein
MGGWRSAEVMIKAGTLGEVTSFYSDWLMERQSAMTKFPGSYKERTRTNSRIPSALENNLSQKLSIYMYREAELGLDDMTSISSGRRHETWL